MLKQHDRAREKGNVLVLSMVVFLIIAGLSAAQVSVTVKNVRQAEFYDVRTQLQACADTGVALAVHEIRYDKSTKSRKGSLGTSDWWKDQHDFGADGRNNTYDEGEGDGVPTYGEPRVYPVSVGDPALGASLFVYVDEDTMPGIKIVTSTAVSATGDNSVSVTYYLKPKLRTVRIPREAAVFVEPTTQLQFGGNSFRIDGNDYAADGTPTFGEALYGVATDPAATAGDNKTAIIDELGAREYDQVLGKDGEPSVGEAEEEYDLSALVDELMKLSTHTLAPGDYTNPTLGNWDSKDLRVTTVTGDVSLTGKGYGAGILVVDGNLLIDGQFEFKGLVICRGEVSVVGGGQGIHIYGSLVATDYVKVSGNADILFSSETLDAVETSIAKNVPDGYSVVYFKQD